MKNEYPQATGIERKLLSALLKNKGAAIPLITSLLKPEDFYRQDNRWIYEAIIAIAESGAPPDTLLIAEELKRKGVLERLDYNYLLSLPEAELSTARAEIYARTIKDKAILRQLINIGEELADEAKSEKQTPGKLLSGTEKRLSDLMLGDRNKDFENLSSVVKRAAEQIRALFGGAISGVSTGLRDLDKITNGFQPSNLILLAARPSMGKTALALNMAVGAARKDKKVAIFSLEMSALSIGIRMLSMESGIDSQHLNTGRLAREEVISLTDAQVRLEELPIYIDDMAGISLLEMRSKARRLRHEHGLDFIVIDYLQLMQGTRSENRQQEISEISRGLKSLAKELDVPVLALSQLSRNVEMRAEKKPQLSDLRESGSLEQDADIVMFLYRDEYYNRDEAESQNLAELIIAKNRNGPTTSIMMQFTKETMKFNDLTRVEP